MISPALMWPLLGLEPGIAAAFHRGLADSVLEPEGGAAGRELIAVLAPDHFDSGKLFVCAARLLGQACLQHRGVWR